MNFEIKLILNEAGRKVTGIKEKEFIINSFSESEKDIENAINDVFPAPNLIETYICKKVLEGVNIGSTVLVYGYADDMQFGEVVAIGQMRNGIITKYTVIIVDEYGKQTDNHLHFDIAGKEITYGDTKNMHWIEPFKRQYLEQYLLYTSRDAMINEIRERVNATEKDVQKIKENDPIAAKMILTDLSAIQLNNILNILKGEQ